MRMKIMCSAVVILVLAAPASAQAPQAEHNVSMSMAQAIIAGALEQCGKSSYKISVVVVDKAGQLAAALRGDGTAPHTVETARLKAYTSRARSQTSAEFVQATASGDAALLRNLPGVIALGGGVPIKFGSEVIGAVGVAGAPGSNDEVCAKAGLDRVSAQLQP